MMFRQQKPDVLANALGKGIIIISPMRKKKREKE
jgi:hypothetical protein